MSGDDLTSSQLSEPPQPPLPEGTTRQQWADLGTRIATATEPHLRTWFWGEGVCLNGLLDLAEDGPTPPAVTRFLHEQAGPGVGLVHVNNLAPGAAAARVAARTGDERLLQMVLAGLDWLASSPIATRDDAGTLEHWPGSVWADTAYMAGGFLLHAGLLMDRTEPVQEAVDQWLAHARILQHSDTHLMAHGSHRGETIWCFWGRANAWLALSAVELLERLGGRADVAGLDEIRERLGLQLRALAQLQPEHGVWDVLVDGQVENRGVLETSAAAGLSAAMLRAATVLPAPDLLEPGLRAIRGALAYVDAGGDLQRVSAGTVLQLIPFGYSVIRNDRLQPWGQGLALHAVAAVLRAPDRTSVVTP